MQPSSRGQLGKAGHSPELHSQAELPHLAPQRTAPHCQRDVPVPTGGLDVLLGTTPPRGGARGVRRCQRAWPWLSQPGLV